ncbi:MAG TPA: diguanylate cyclase [Gaiellaceae bacterium]|nr:diguanylate cyclase [Gaiellaceae bacterium]
MRRALLPPRLVAVVAPVCIAGLAVYGWAGAAFAGDGHSATVLVGILMLLLASTVAQKYPVPVEGVDTRGVNLGFVFGVSGVVLFGWDGGVLIAATSQVATGLWERHRPVRFAYNAAVFAIAAALAGALVIPFGQMDARDLALKVAICSIVQYAVNLVLVTAVVRADAGGSYLRLIRGNVGWTVVPFALMGATGLILVVLWQRTPWLASALLGPLLAISLYQRSQHRALTAMRLALTDPLTGLGNHRHFHERLQRELSLAQEHQQSLTLCFIDVDDFKRINDRFGHPAGDQVLSQIATRLRQGGEGFRLGGDEFAILLPKHDEPTALSAAHSIVNRIAAIDIGEMGPITVSAGVATFPDHGGERDELIRLADNALYWAKEHGKNRVRVSRADVVELSDLKRLAIGRDRAARFRAAASLARAVDTRDAYTGSHSQRVAMLAGRIAERLGVSPEQVELARLAGSLHDLGKLAIPEEILRKPGALSDPERVVLERHPQIGFRMLESLGVDPIAQWVLHHHERWDGTGYPDRLAGEEIPIGARIIFVADAYDAMTSDRVYRRSLTREDAIAELERCAGSQFDPTIVSLFVAELASEPVGDAVLAS